MNKLFLIIKREYLTRVKKRSFILLTLLTPILMIAFMVVVTLIMVSGNESLKVLVKDENHLTRYYGLADGNSIIFKVDTTRDIESLKAAYTKEGYDGVFHIEKKDDWNVGDFHATYYSDKKIGIASKETIRDNIATLIEQAKIAKSGYDRNLLKSFKTNLNIKTFNTEEGVSENIGAAAGLSSIMGILIYMMILIYGTMVMRSVMEEKNSRIMEVMVSSVKPFDMMLGKIIGVGAVGLTQFAIWVVLLFLGSLGMSLFLAPYMADLQHTAAASAPNADQIADMQAKFDGLANLPFGKILFLFVFYFLGGYFLYSSLFAAVGSAVSDDMSDSQSLTIPITIPVILSFYIGISAVNNPNSAMAFWSSMFPLFSPIVMTARIPFDPPWWQIILSLVILYSTCIMVTWLAARIYRVGVLMYGKKVSLKEIGKWIFYKD